MDLLLYLKKLSIKPEVTELYREIIEDVYKTEKGDRNIEIQKITSELSLFENHLLLNDISFNEGNLEKDSYHRWGIIITIYFSASAARTLPTLVGR